MGRKRAVDTRLGSDLIDHYALYRSLWTNPDGVVRLLAFLGVVVKRKKTETDTAYHSRLVSKAMNALKKDSRKG